MVESVALELLKNDQEVDTSTINILAADAAVRTDFYDSLKATQKESLFPKKYLTQKSFAESIVYSLASDDDYEVASEKYLAEKTAVYKGVTYKFYLFKIQFNDDSGEDYLGIAGGFPVNSKELKPVKDLSYIEWDETLTKDNMSDLFEKAVQRWDENENQTNEEE